MFFVFVLFMQTIQVLHSVNYFANTDSSGVVKNSNSCLHINGK